MPQFPGQNSIAGGGRQAFGENAPDGSGTGVFAAVLQGASPKYARNSGERRDTQQRNSMARMFIRVDAAEQQLFQSSVGDSFVRSNIVPYIAGDPLVPQSQFAVPNTARPPASANGYLDFILQQVQMPLQENFQAVQTLADNYVAYFFGQTPPIWAFSGQLINTRQDDQAANMFRLYVELLRGTQMARRQKVLSIRFDSYIVTGVLTNFVPAIQSTNELLVPFSFQLLVKRVHVTNYNAGWRPTVAEGAFAADPNAIAYDGRPRSESRVRTTVGVVPGTPVTPTPQTQADPRTLQSSPPPNNGEGNFTPGAVTSSAATSNPNSNSLANFTPGPASPAAAVVSSTGQPETLNATLPPNPNVSSNSNTQEGPPNI
jgi:hypothetical protein